MNAPAFFGERQALCPAQAPQVKAPCAGLFGDPLRASPSAPPLPQKRPPLP